jgi:hypothetical protein
MARSDRRLAGVRGCERCEEKGDEEKTASRSHFGIQLGSWSGLATR